MNTAQDLKPVDRVLLIATDVRRGEGSTAILLALNLFLILAAYEVITPVREALLGAGAGATVKAYLYAAIVILLAIVVRVYDIVANRMSRRRLINVVTVFFAANLTLFFVVFQLGVPLFTQGVVFFLWVSIFGVVVVAQFWAFANDFYSAEEGARLFPVVALGASLGAVVASMLTGAVIPLFGVYPPLLVAAVILMASLWLTNIVEARGSVPKETDLPDPLTTHAGPAASGRTPLNERRS